MTIGAGVSGRAAGGASGGIEMLTVSSNKGFYVGGALEGIKIWLNDDINQQAYGEDFDLDAVVKSTGGNFMPAVGIRSKLEKAAHQAVWGNN